MRKKRTTHKKTGIHRTGLREPGTHTVKHRSKTARRRYRSRPKGFLSEMFNPINVQTTGKAMLSAAVGAGAGLLVLNAIVGSSSTPANAGKRGGILAAAAFVAGAVFKLPNVAAGLAGLATVELIKPLLPAGLSESNPYLQADSLDKLPPFLAADGSPLNLAEVNSYLQQAAEYAEYEELYG